MVRTFSSRAACQRGTRSPHAPLSLRQMVRLLNAHHDRTAAGFYGNERLPGRWFRARLFKGETLQVFNWTDWVVVPDGTSFRDHNGKPILTVCYPDKGRATAITSRL